MRKLIVVPMMLLLILSCGREEDDPDFYQHNLPPATEYTNLGIGIVNRTGVPIDHDLIDCMFLEVEQHLGYESTPAYLTIVVEPGLFLCPPNVLGKVWCGGAFYPGYECYMQVVWDIVPFLVEMNRYFLWYYGDPTWNCESYVNCMGHYAKAGDVVICEWE